jgi:hypothetical protein
VEAGVGIGDDGGQGLVDLVRDRGGELAEGRHARDVGELGAGLVQGRLGPLALGDVVQVDRQPRFRRVQAGIHPPPRPRGARLELHHSLLPQRAMSLVIERRPDQVREQLPDGPAEKVRGPEVPPRDPSGLSQCALVDERVAPLAIHREELVTDALQDRLGAPLCRSQRFLRALALRYVAVDGEVAGDVRLLSPERDADQLHVDRPAVLAGDGHFAAPAAVGGQLPAQPASLRFA